jgi:hypothetical protein
MVMETQRKTTEVPKSEIQSGDAILWAGHGPADKFFSFVLGLFFPNWRSRKWKPWHTGFAIRVLDSGEVITFQAVAKGVHAITYDNVDAMGDIKVYRWLNNLNQSMIDKYVSENYGRPYDFLGYLWTICGSVSMVWFHHPYRLSSWMLFCWENLAGFMCFMGRELQPDDEPRLISKIMTALETNKIDNPERLKKRMEKERLENIRKYGAINIHPTTL